MQITPLLFFFNILHASDQLTILESRSYQEEASINPTGMFVDEDGDLIGLFGNLSHFTKKGVQPITSWGEGPGELKGAVAVGYRANQVHVFEFHRRVQPFQKSAGKYQFTESWFRMETKGGFMPRNSAVFVDGRWFISGVGSYWDRRDPKDVYFMISLSENGEIQGNHISGEIDPKINESFLLRHLATDGKRVYYMVENSLELNVLDVETEGEKNIQLAKPEFYRVIEDETYNRQSLKKFKGSKFFESWFDRAGSYSRINHMAVDQDMLILSVRTTRDHLKRFGLVYYDLKTLTIQKIVYTDDYLLAVRNGKYFMLAGGYPLIDQFDEAITINVCKLEAK